MNANISLSRLSSVDENQSVTEKLIACYQSVFAAEPWNEWRKCANPDCKARWGVHEHHVLQDIGFVHCDQPVVEYWPHHQVLSDLTHEIVPGVSCWLATDGPTMVGFCWGYEIDGNALEKKVKLLFMDKLEAHYGSGLRIAYQDELGVVSSHRGQKIARSLFMRRHEDFLAQGLQAGIVRTRRLPNPSVTYQWFTEKLGYRVLAAYPGNDGRVILGRDFAGLGPLLQQ